MSRFAILHSGWIEHAEVGADEVAVLAVLALHVDRHGRCFPTQGLLARLLGRSRPWINKVIGRLVEIGLIERTHRQRDDGGDRACLYRLIAPAEAQKIYDRQTSVTDTVSSKCDTGSHTADSITPESEHKEEIHHANASIDSKSTVVVQFQSSEIPAEDWQPTDRDLCWAMERYPDLDLQVATDRFVTRCRAKGYKYRDLGSAWRSWLTDDAGKANARPDRTPRGKASPSYSRYAAWAGVANHKDGNHRAA
ncbi:MAG: helix-turn-helix domain-containing protein [Rhodospirillaceae bacterium]